MSDTPWDEDHDEIDGIEDDSGIGAFDAFIVAEEADISTDPWPAMRATDDDSGTTTVTFTASNPTETVVVTALLDGKILRVELAPEVVAMTEEELSREIVVIANLARLQAQAALHTIVAAMMRRTGLDPAATRSFIEHDLHLPSPELVKRHRAEIFAARLRDGE